MNNTDMEMQIKATVKYHFVKSLGMAILIKMNITGVGEDVKKLETLYIFCGNVK